MIAEPAQFLRQIIQPETNADVEKITVGIDFGGKPPFWAFKFGRNGFFQILKIPAPKHYPAGGNKKHSDKRNAEDSKFGLFQILRSAVILAQMMAKIN
jgi:hypothetical protein